MGNIRTHTRITTQQPQTAIEPRFTLNTLFPISTNIDVRKYPKRVIAWGLMPGETVSVHMARTQSLGNPNWALRDEECCPCILEPDPVVNAHHMPYKRCHQVVILTDEDPAIHIDDAGVYYFEYHGNHEITLEHYDDPVLRKPCGERK
ncbi:hypothetical protein E4T80_09885 [Muribacter muris]|uniref:Uncharacterized protein n=1 Tax=Muribacter muris TaxID=67855 RepID=A0A4Y9JV46_9PAST|nr:hypothetical protein [Muribacter muris]MBF0785768.1 hypothetical protein [Muribacter muris]MBF0828260.1 hypothetical protein [Muribacter muris]TFV08590.1 hypothetical protein E4T80_09885 [Muribacter muris]